MNAVAVRESHSDREKDFKNSALKAFCTKFASRQAVAVVTLRIKNKTRAILQEAGEDSLGEWLRETNLAAHQLRSVARQRLTGCIVSLR